MHKETSRSSIWHFWGNVGPTCIFTSTLFYSIEKIWNLKQTSRSSFLTLFGESTTKLHRYLYCMLFGEKKSEMWKEPQEVQFCQFRGIVWTNCIFTSTRAPKSAKNFDFMDVVEGFEARSTAHNVWTSFLRWNSQYSPLWVVYVAPKLFSKM